MSTKSLREATYWKDCTIAPSGTKWVLVARCEGDQLDLAVAAARITGRAVGDRVDVPGQDAGDQDRPGRPVKQPAADELHRGSTLGTIEDNPAAKL